MYRLCSPGFDGTVLFLVGGSLVICTGCDQTSPSERVTPHDRDMLTEVLATEILPYAIVAKKFLSDDWTGWRTKIMTGSSEIFRLSPAIGWVMRSHP